MNSLFKVFATTVPVDLTIIIVAFFGIITTFITVYFTYLGIKLQKSVNDTNDKVDQYHGSVNSKMDELLRLTKVSAMAEGHLAGVEAEKTRQMMIAAAAAADHPEDVPSSIAKE